MHVRSRPGVTSSYPGRILANALLKLRSHSAQLARPLPQGGDELTQLALEWPNGRRVSGLELFWWWIASCEQFRDGRGTSAR